MLKKLSLLLALISCPGSPVWAHLDTVSLEWSKPQIKLTEKNTSLQKQRHSEDNKQWSSCIQLAKKNVSKFSLVEGWIFLSWIRCAKPLAIEAKSSKIILEILSQIEQKPSLQYRGPWSKSLQTEILKLRVLIAEIDWKSNPDASWIQLEEVFQMKNLVEKEIEAKAYYLAADISLAKGDFPAARALYEQSLNINENRSVRDRLTSVNLALNEGQAVSDEKQTKQDFIQDDELRIDEQMKTALKINDWIAFLEIAVDYLQKFPSGRRAKFANDKAQEIYLTLFDKSEDSNYRSLKDRALNVLLKADFLRITDWARAAHRKGDFQGALRLAEMAVKMNSQSSLTAAMLYIAGRSAHFTGEYKKASDFFAQYLQKHSGAEEIIEVLFRTALLDFRTGKYSSAIATLEKILSTKGVDRYELNSRYWLVRALQATQNPRASSEIDAILNRFPFSYYGLKLRSEKQNGVLEWPTQIKVDKEIKVNWILTGMQKGIWERIKILANQGWVQEAGFEIQELPIPAGTSLKLLLAQEWAQAQVFPAVIKLVNEVGDLAPELRSLDVMSLALPRIFADAIDQQARKQNLSPILVRSLIRQESAFGAKATSTSNALGLMQLIPPTAQEVAQELGLKKMEIPDDVFNKETNIQMGTFYLGKMIKRFGGNVALGLAAYNAGPTRLDTFVNSRAEVRSQRETHSSIPADEIWFDELPWSETSFYVKAILRNVMLYKIFERAEKVLPEERRVQFSPVLWADLVL